MSAGTTGASAWRKIAADGSAYVSALDGTSQVAFPAVAEGGFRERMIANPSATASIFINVTGDAAVANGAGTFCLAPLQTLFTEAANAMNMIGTSGQPVTIRER